MFSFICLTLFLRKSSGSPELEIKRKRSKFCTQFWLKELSLEKGYIVRYYRKKSSPHELQRLFGKRGISNYQEISIQPCSYIQGFTQVLLVRKLAIWRCLWRHAEYLRLSVLTLTIPKRHANTKSVPISYWRSKCKDICNTSSMTTLIIMIWLSTKSIAS